MLVSEKFLQITSGSFGEGLEMKGSDIDTMYVQRDVRVYEDINKVSFNSRESPLLWIWTTVNLGLRSFDWFNVTTLIFYNCVNK